MLVTLNNLRDAILVVESLHFAVPLPLFRRLNLHQFLVLSAELLVSRGQLYRTLETLLGSVEVILSLVRKSHPIICLWIVWTELKRVFARLDTVWEAIFLEEAEGAVSIENIQNVTTLLLLLLCKGLLLAFRHVLEDRDAAAVKTLSIRVLFEQVYQLAAHLPYFFVKDKLLVQGRLCVALRVALDVCQGDFDPDCGSYRGTHALSVLLGALQIHIYLMVNAIVLALLDLKECDLTALHYFETVSQISK